MSPDPEGKCQRAAAAAAAAAAAFGGQKAKAKDPDGARMEYQPDHPADRACHVLCVCCVRQFYIVLCVCAVILLGIEFQIEIQQTRNYCQRASSGLLRNFTS